MSLSKGNQRNGQHLEALLSQNRFERVCLGFVASYLNLQMLSKMSCIIYVLSVKAMCCPGAETAKCSISSTFLEPLGMILKGFSALMRKANTGCEAFRFLLLLAAQAVKQNYLACRPFKSRYCVSWEPISHSLLFLAVLVDSCWKFLIYYYFT